jgi:two-component system response regulator HydG
VGYIWKGNVRQLKNVVESLVVMDLDEMLDMDDLSPDLLGDVGGAKASAFTSGADPAVSFLDEGSSELIGKSMKEIERWATEQTLKMANQNRKETARILGISERNLYRLIQKYGLKQSDEKNSESTTDPSSEDGTEEIRVDPF